MILKRYLHKLITKSAPKKQYVTAFFKSTKTSDFILVEMSTEEYKQLPKSFGFKTVTDARTGLPARIDLSAFPIITCSNLRDKP